MEWERPAGSSVAMSWLGSSCGQGICATPDRLSGHILVVIPVRMYINTEPFLVLQYRYIYYVVNQLMCRFAMAWSWKNQSNCLLMLGFLSEKKVRRRGIRINFTPTRKFWTIMENYSLATDFVQRVLFFRGSTWSYFHLQPAAPNLQLTKYK